MINSLPISGITANYALPDYFELTPDLVWIAGRDGFLKKVNPAVIKKMGYTEAELYSKPVSGFLYPDDIERTLQNRSRLFNGEVLHNFCNRYITRSGELIWLEWTSVFIADKDFVLAIAKDITARKKMEAEAAEQFHTFKGLATHFKSRIENDRKYFAYELHEELAQLVSVVNMDVGWLNMHVQELPEQFRERTGHVSAVCKLMIKTIQRLAFSISPQMLDDLGLVTTMEWLCNEFSILNGIACTFESDYDENVLTQEVKIDFFRICQEVLSELLNPSGAGQITIRILDTGEHIELQILDSAAGFDHEGEKQKEVLSGIQKRVKSINGKVTLQNHTARGSGISVSVKKIFRDADVMNT